MSLPPGRPGNDSGNAPPRASGSRSTGAGLARHGTRLQDRSAQLVLDGGQ
ncbi:hypothetical protein ACFPM0_23885 [Pseudonocardia sulfidoxydans]